MALLVIGFAAVLPLGAQTTWNGQSSLPAGLAMVQIKGNLVCPPLRMPGHGLLLACDDRTVTLVTEQGTVLWSLEMDRLIRGPLFALSDTMALLALSGDQIVAFRMDGKKAWQERLEGSGQSWFLGLPDGRMVQVFMDGKVLLRNPDGRVLVSLDAGQPILPVPKLIETSVELHLGDGSVRRLLASGELSVGSVAPAKPVAGPADLIFNTGIASAGDYAVHIASSGATLDFSSKGALGHWIVDNRSPGVVVWGDSLWRCFIYRRQDSGGQGQASLALSTPRYGFGGLFKDISGSAELEWRYLRSLLQADPAGGTRKALDHVSQALAAGRLPGRIQFYEDSLAWVLETETSGGNPDVSVIADALAIMARFPSLRHLPRVVRLLDVIHDEAVERAVLGFCVKLGSDPDGLALEAIDRALPRWIAAGRMSALMKPLLEVIEACGASWPAGLAANRLKSGVGTRF